MNENGERENFDFNKNRYAEVAMFFLFIFFFKLTLNSHITKESCDRSNLMKAVRFELHFVERGSDVKGTFCHELLRKCPIWKFVKKKKKCKNGVG